MLMNCDQAFDQMTSSAPQESTDLREHLAQCPRCREMREVLSPAVALFSAHVSDAPSQPAALPRSVGDDSARRPSAASEESIQVAQELAAQLSGQTSVQRAMRRRRPLGWTRGVALFAGGMLAASIVAMCASAVIPEGKSQHGVNPAHGTKCTWLNKHRTHSSRRETAKDVVVGCIACHVADRSADARPTQQFDALRDWFESRPVTAPAVPAATTPDIRLIAVIDRDTLAGARSA